METYAAWVSIHPFQNAMLLFAVLGTAGEVVAASVRRRGFALPCSPFQLLLKALAWALLGIVIKYGFVGMRGFTEALIAKHWLPAFMGYGVGKAFAISLFTNMFFGPQMMAFHRIEDNLILGEKGFAGIEKAWATLVWFWIPAHTLTFSLPPSFQIALAAFWGLVLGLILGLTRKPQAA